MCAAVSYAQNRRDVGARALAALLFALVLASTASLRADDRAAGAAEPAASAVEDTGLWLSLRAESGNHRSFRQFEPTTGETRTYDARVYGGIGVALGYEHGFDASPLSVWLTADYFRSLAFTSGARRLGRTVETVAQRMNAAAGLSLYPWGADETAFDVLGGIGAMTFDFTMPAPDDEDDRSMQRATGNYTLLRTGVGARTPLSVLSLSIRGSYLAGVHTGKFGARSAADQPQGFEAAAAVEYRWLSWLEVGIFGGLTLLWLELAPLPARPTDAPASIRDRYLVFGIAAKARA